MSFVDGLKDLCPGDSRFSELPTHRARPGSIGQRVPNPGPGWAGGGTVHTRLADCVCAHGRVDCSGSCSSRELQGPPPSTSLPSTGAGSHTGPAQEPQVRRGQRASGVLEGSSHLGFGLGPTQKPLLGPRPGPLLGLNARALRLPGDRRRVMGHAPRRAGQTVSQRGSHLPGEPPRLRARPGHSKGPGGRRRKRKCSQGP